MRKLLLVFTVGGILFASAAFAPIRAAVPGCGTDRGDWTELAVGDYPQLGLPSAYGDFRETTGYAVDPLRPERMWVTNSKSVLRSVDGGCSWHPVFALRPLPVDDQAAPGEVLTELDEIAAIAVPDSRRGGDRLYLGVHLRGPARQNLGTVIVRSDDGGATWQTLRAGLPPQRELRQLVVAPNDPDRLYAVFVSAAKQPPTDVYVSHDGGRSWTNRGGFLPGTAALEVRGSLTVDRHYPDVLWGWGDRRNQLFTSTDGARSWRRLEVVNEPVTALGVHSTPDGPTRIVALESLSTQVLSSVDSGATWRRRPAPSGQYGDSVAFGHTADAFGVLYSQLPGGVAEPARVFRYDAAGDRFAEITPALAEPPLLNDLRTDATASPRLYARSAHAIWRFDGPLDPDPSSQDEARGQEELPFGLRPVPVAKAKPAALNPSRTAVTLAPGESATVDYTLTVPARPTPLDLGILIDTSGSMGPSIGSLREQLQGLIENLAARGVRLRVGVADYKEYENVPPYSGTEGGRGAYFRRRDLGPVNEELAQALGALQPLGGGTGEATPALAALYQLATGHGQQVDPNRPSRNDIAPGQQLTYRQRALRVVVHVADAPYREGAPVNPSYPAPTAERTIAALTDRGIRHVGIDVAHGPSPQGAGAVSLRHLARETGALATDAVDCDGDGAADLAAGDPLVCTVHDDSPTVGNVVEAEGVSNLADALDGVLRAVRDDGTVDVAAHTNGSFAATVTPGPLTADLTEHHRLRYRLRITCPVEATGQTGSAAVVARVNRAVVAGASIIVTCGSAPAPGGSATLPDDEPPGAPGVVTPTGPGPAAVAPGSPPPPAPIPIPAPAPGTAPAPGVSGAGAQSPAGAGQPAAAAAEEEQRQASLATATSGSVAQAGLPAELLMTAHTPPRANPATPHVLLLGGAALLTATATWWALRGPSEARPSQVLVRRRRV